MPIERLDAREVSRFLAKKLASAGYYSLATALKRISRTKTFKSIKKTANGVACFEGGSGDVAALVWGVGDPNEPSGAASVVRLATMLERNLRRVLGEITWYLVPVLDPEGLSLNYWVEMAYTPENYAIWSYRRPLTAAREYCFTLKEGAKFEEAKLLEDIMREIRPDLVISLHNQPFPGSYCIEVGKHIMLDAFPAIVRVLNSSVWDVDLLFDEYIRASAGVYTVDLLRILPSESMCGVFYAVAKGYAKYGAIFDMALYEDSKASSRKPTKMELASLVKESERACEKLNGTAKLILRSIGRFIDKRHPVYEYYADAWTSEGCEEPRELARRSAFESELAYYHLYKVLWRRLYFWGQTIRLLKEAALDTSIVRSWRRLAEAKFEVSYRELRKRSRIKPVPKWKQITLQVASTLFAAVSLAQQEF